MLKGYNVPDGYMGWIEELKIYRLFACERDYIEYMEEQTKLTQKVIHVVVPNKTELNKHVINKIVVNRIEVK